MSTVEENKALVRRVLAAFGEADIEPLRAAIDPGVVFYSHSPGEIFRAGGRHEGVADSIAALSALATDFTVHRVEVKEVIGEGDVVWVTSELEFTARRHAKRLTLTVASRWLLRDGRILSVDEFWDTCAAALKQGLVVAKD